MAEFVGSIPFSVSAAGELTLNITGQFIYVDGANHNDFRVSINGDTPVSYTHLTLPTIYSV